MVSIGISETKKYKERCRGKKIPLRKEEEKANM
jgi:hypothetical protein